MTTNKFGLTITEDEGGLKLTDIDGIGSALQNLKINDTIIGINGVSTSGYSF